MAELLYKITLSLKYFDSQSISRQKHLSIYFLNKYVTFYNNSLLIILNKLYKVLFSICKLPFSGVYQRYRVVIVIFQRIKSLLTGLFPSSSYAVFNFVVNGGLLLCEILVERHCGKKQLVQLALTVIYSVFIQFTSMPFQMIPADSMLSRVLLSAAACSVLAVGISFTLNSKFAVLPMEGFISSLAHRTHRNPFSLFCCSAIFRQ